MSCQYQYLMYNLQELTKLIHRFDVNKDGVVDYVDFLRFVTGACDDASRQAKRVSEAGEEILEWVISKQNRKVAKEGMIDSLTAWKLFKTRDGILRSPQIDKVREGLKTQSTYAYLNTIAASTIRYSTY